MNFGDILGKVKDLAGEKAKDAASDLGLNAIVETLQGLLGKAEGSDKNSLSDIIAVLKKAIGDKVDIAAIVKQCMSIAGGIGNSGLKETVEKLLKKIG